MISSSLCKFARRNTGALMTAAVLGLILGCVSGPVEISDTLSPAELIQRGQEASDRNRYKQALQYYTAVIDRFPLDADVICAAEYEIAFIRYKQKKYEDARLGFEALLARYAASGGETLPPQFKRLAELVLEKIAEKAPKGRATGEG